MVRSPKKKKFFSKMMDAVVDLLNNLHMQTRSHLITPHFAESSSMTSPLILKPSKAAARFFMLYILSPPAARQAETRLAKHLIFISCQAGSCANPDVTLFQLSPMYVSACVCKGSARNQIQRWPRKFSRPATDGRPLGFLGQELSLRCLRLRFRAIIEGQFYSGVNGIT